MSDLAYRKNNHCISCQKELDAPRTGRKYQRPRDRDDNRQQIGWLDLLRSRSLCDIRSEFVPILKAVTYRCSTLRPPTPLPLSIGHWRDDQNLSSARKSGEER